MIIVEKFMPFETRDRRYPDDYVLSLRFEYDFELIQVIRSVLRSNRWVINKRRLIYSPGGWLPHYRVWFVEKEVYHEALRPVLIDCGYYLNEADLVDPCYRVLGLMPPVSIDEIKAAYRRRAKALHPDAGGSHEAFIALQIAYEEALAHV